MKKQYFWLIFIVLIVLILSIILTIAVRRLTSGPAVNINEENQKTGQEPILVGNASSSDIIITEPVVNGIIKSPLTVSGQAKGNWFFEATLPVRLVTAADAVIVSGPGQAQGDWMTDQLVPFTATLNFTTTATSGYLIIAKDNPSGLPQNDGAVKIPVNFK